jgi:stress-induced-phosphoprotein 1
VDPNLAALKDGLADAERALKRATAPSRRSQEPSFDRDPFGPDMMTRLAANPKFAPYLADPTFVAKLRGITEAKDETARTAALTSLLGGGLGAPGGGAQDPRMMEVLMYLLGLDRGAPGGPGSAGMEEDDMADGYPSWNAPPPAPRAPEPTKAEKAAAEKAAREAAEAAAEAAMTDEERAVKARKKAAVAKKEEGNVAYKARDFQKALALYDEAISMDNEEISFILNKVCEALFL